MSISREIFRRALGARGDFHRWKTWVMCLWTFLKSIFCHPVVMAIMVWTTMTKSINYPEEIFWTFFKDSINEIKSNSGDLNNDLIRFCSWQTLATNNFYIHREFPLWLHIEFPTRALTGTTFIFEEITSNGIIHLITMQYALLEDFMDYLLLAIDSLTLSQVLILN